MTMPSTPARLAPVLQDLTSACEQDPQVDAAWLSGSLARGTGDDWSDIDLHVLVTDAPVFAARLREWLPGTMTVVLLDAIPGVPGAFIVVTDGWLHVDILIHDTTVFTQDNQPVRVLYDPAHRIREVRADPHEMTGAPYFPDDEVRRFLYFMGATVTVVRRREWVALAQGTAMIRDTLLVPLMLAENGVRKADGAKRLNRYLTDQQISTLRALPPIGYDPGGLLAAQESIARAYLTRATGLAARCGAAWPAELAQASTRLWADELDIRL